MLRDNYLEVLSKVEAAAKSSGREKDDINVIAVTKTIDCERIQEIVDLGIKDLGENRVQEFLDKYDKINGDVSWHLIGHLQTNKVKYIIGKVSLIHSVDSLKLAKKINEEAFKKGIVQDILIQVNIGKEESKFGFELDDVIDAIKEISQYKNIKINGLMAIAPKVINKYDLKLLFCDLYNKSIDIDDKNMDNISMNVMSMGMSNDFELAITMGSNTIRVGRGFFGER